MPGNPFKSLLNLYQKPELIPAEVTQVKHLSPEDKQLIHRIGLTTAQVRRDLLKDIQIQWDRMQIYHQVERALEHPIVGAAAELYGNYCTVLSPLHNSTCWVTSDSPTYQRELTKLLDRIGVEESIFDWAYSTGTYGDLFIKINGIPGKGIISVDDNEHPLMTSRVDHEGALIGYYKAPLGQIADAQKLIPPWDYVHFRLLGGKKKRPRFCLRGNTRIRLLNGTNPTIKEMAENVEKYIGKSILSINPESRRLEYDTIVTAQKTRLNTQLVRVHLDNGKYVDATPDHPFMLRDGTYREAQYLKPNDSLMPLYTKIAEHDLIGYEMVFDPGKNGKGVRGGYVYTHRIPFNPKQKKGYIIHHGPDFNPLNNDIENLTQITKKEHVNIHQGDLDSQRARSATRLATIEKKRQDPGYQAKLLEKRILRGKWEIRTCALSDCNNTFACSVKNSKKYCSPDCVCLALSVPKSEEHKQHMRKPKSEEHAKHIAEGRKKALAKKKEQGIIFIPWNYGLTKETDPRIFIYAEKLRQTNTGKKQSRETIEKRGKTKRENKQKALLMECLLNHKVVKVEKLLEREDTYDITTKKNHNFPLDVGIFVHNSDPMYTEFRTMHLLTGMDIKQVTTKYGTSLLMNALPCYRRLRLAEDSLLLARLSRGLIRYIWKLKVSHCLRGNTKIWLLDGTTPTIQEMAENPDKYIGKSVNVVNKTTLTSGKIRGVKKTRLNAKLVRVHLDNGKYVDCTPDHKFLLWFGDYIEAQELSLGTVLYSTPGAKPHLIQESPPVFISWVEVVKVEKLSEREDTYDIEINDQTPNFPLEAGVFVHNSSMEAVGELVDQYSTVLREARALNTRSDDPGFEEKENPMCLRGDTQIRLCNGKDVTIKEMVEDSCKYKGQSIWSINLFTKELEIDQIIRIQKTRLNAEIVRVHLDNGKYVDATPDHRFLLFNKSYRQAWELERGDELATLFSESSKRWVKSVEPLTERKDTYDLTTKKNHNFALTNGIFVHNSCIEDIFLPVWDNVGDLTYDKIGGEADIRWIKDVEDLRQQLAAALRCPLPLLGAYLKEAAGPLGSEIIEKVDINFARIARKLQRTVRNGIKRICQIHLAWMNMDPDPNLFDIQMPEMSTAEEESLKDSLNSGTDVIAKFMSMMDDIEGEGGKKIDRVEVFNYLNEKILKLEDFDLTEFMTSIEAIPECKRRSERKAKEEKARGILEKAREVNSKNGGIERKGPQFDTDLFSYVPTTIYDGNGKLYENRIKKFRGWLGKERCMHVWESKFSQVKVIPEGADTDVKQGQKLLPFAK
jgi:intein/homing endonuclease